MGLYKAMKSVRNAINKYWMQTPAPIIPKLAISFWTLRKKKKESEVAQSCPTLRDPMDCSLPGSSVHGIFQARVLEWGAIAFSDACYSF